MVQEALNIADRTDELADDHTKLLSDNSPDYVSGAFRDYLHPVDIGHILAAPFHPQTNFKMEYYQQSFERECTGNHHHSVIVYAIFGVDDVCQAVAKVLSRLELLELDFIRERHRPYTQKGGLPTAMLDKL